MSSEFISVKLKMLGIDRQVLVIALPISAILFRSSSHFKYLRKFIAPSLQILFVIRVISYFKQNDNDSLSRKSLVSFLSTALKEVGASSENLQSFLNFIVGDFLGLYVISMACNLPAIFSLQNILTLKKNVFEGAYESIKWLPFIQKEMQKEKNKLESDFEKDLKIESRKIGGPNSTALSSLPNVGISHEEILSMMKSVTEVENVKWRTGRVSGAVYHGVDSHQALLNEAFGYYSLSNPLHPDIWPSCMKFESEIIAMTASLVRGGVETVCGCTSSGGTESIILAIKSHRDYYRAKYHIQHPEMVACITAHAAVDKACDMMGIKLIKVRMDPVTCKVDVNAVRRAIGPNTIMLYSSAPNYPQGVIDPIRELGKLAVRYNIGLHVDCCLGGFILPFAKKLGYNVPDFDFSIPGVTSMSLDTHKYGYALKGTSVVLYRNRDIRQCQYFCYADWTGGLYTTPTIAGSRSGGLIAQTWASLVAMGENGYMHYAKEILSAAQTISAGVEKIPGLKILGKTEAMIVCFVGENGVNCYAVADRMSKKGWSLNSHQHPPSVHICCTVRHAGREQEILDDLAASVKEVRADSTAHSGTAAIYGMTSSLPSGPVNELLKIYNDVVLKL